MKAKVVSKRTSDLVDLSLGLCNSSGAICRRWCFRSAQTKWRHDTTPSTSQTLMLLSQAQTLLYPVPVSGSYEQPHHASNALPLLCLQSDTSSLQSSKCKRRQMWRGHKSSLTFDFIELPWSITNRHKPNMSNLHLKITFWSETSLETKIEILYKFTNSVYTTFSPTRNSHWKKTF